MVFSGAPPNSHGDCPVKSFIHINGYARRNQNTHPPLCCILDILAWLFNCRCFGL